jgi:hypothetical protein
MKKGIILLMVLTMMTLTSFEQTATASSIPTFAQLISWVDIDYANFDTQARSLGFSTEGKYNKDYGTDYVYIRKTTKNGFVYTDRLILQVFTATKSNQIQLVTTEQDLVAYYTPQLTAKQFQNTTCLVAAEENESKFCYKTAKYFVTLIDTRTQLSVGEGNSYTVIVKQIK